jgi:hypothetical protein
MKTKLHRHIWAWVTLAALLAPYALRAEGPSSLQRDLTTIGDRVEAFWKEITSVSCTETVEQVKIDPEKNKVLNQKRSVYDYIVFLQWIGAELAVDESRELVEESRKKKKIRRPSHRPLLVTNGFALMMLVFHPRYQSSYVFEQAGEETWQGASYRKLRFEHVRGARSPSALRLEDRIYPLEWQGEAWVDPATGQTARLRVQLKDPIPEIGLVQVSVDVEYSPIENAPRPDSAWMPALARIEAATKRQLWRNEHRFTDYRHFNVETEIKIGDPDLQ